MPQRAAPAADAARMAVPVAVAAVECAELLHDRDILQVSFIAAPFEAATLAGS